MSLGRPATVVVVELETTWTVPVEGRQISPSIIVEVGGNKPAGGNVRNLPNSNEFTIARVRVQVDAAAAAVEADREIEMAVAVEVAETGSVGVARINIRWPE